MDIVSGAAMCDGRRQLGPSPCCNPSSRAHVTLGWRIRSTETMEQLYACSGIQRVRGGGFPPSRDSRHDSCLQVKIDYVSTDPGLTTNIILYTLYVELIYVHYCPHAVSSSSILSIPHHRAPHDDSVHCACYRFYSALQSLCTPLWRQESSPVVSASAQRLVGPHANVIVVLGGPASRGVIHFVVAVPLHCVRELLVFRSLLSTDQVQDPT
jgi:hypothetical protein